jgi:hypothetical protein
VKLIASRLMVAASLVVVGTAGPASAQASQEEGTVEVQAGHPLGASIHYIVHVSHADGSPAADATVTATPIDADGNAGEPVTLTPFGAIAPDGVQDEDATAGQGRYEGFVEFPAAGTWTVRFEADRPAGTAETTVEVLESGATDLDAPDEGGGFAPAVTDDTSSSVGSGTTVLVIAVVVLVALGGIAAVLRIVRRYGPTGTVAADVGADEGR